MRPDSSTVQGLDRFSELSFLSTKSFKIHFQRRGIGPPLILLHGGGTWLYSFRHNIPALGRHFSVFTLDLPGHGYTRPLIPCKKYDSDLAYRTLRDFMDAMDIGKAHLAGHSWGGAWAAGFAEKFPDRVGHLVLMGSSGIHRFDHPVWELMKYRFMEKLLPVFFSKQIVRKGLEASFYNKRRVTSEMSESIWRPLSHTEILKAQLSYSRKIDWGKIRAALPRIRSKTLIVWGRNDRYIPVKYAKKLHSRIPGSRLEIIERCGHSVHEEKPGRVNRLVIDFLESKF